MRSDNKRDRIRWLWRLSVVGFVALTGALAFGYIYLATAISAPDMPGSTASYLLVIVYDYALPALPGAVLSWWLLIAARRRSSALAGGCAGILTIVLAVLGVCIAGFIFGTLLPHTATPLTPIDRLEAVLFFWLFGLLFLSAQPIGWGMFLVGAAAGAVYGALVRRWIPIAHDEEAAPAPEPADAV